MPYRHLSLRTCCFVRTYRIALYSQIGTVRIVPYHIVIAKLYRTILTTATRRLVSHRSNVLRRAHRIETHLPYRTRSIIAVPYRYAAYRTLRAPFVPHHFPTYRTNHTIFQRIVPFRPVPYQPCRFAPERSTERKSPLIRQLTLQEL